MKRLSIAILSSNRYDLLRATVNSILDTMTYPEWEMFIFNHNESIGVGWNALAKRVNCDYVMLCQDDWYFMERWNWAETAVKILSKNKDIGCVRLRKDGDSQQPEEKIGEGVVNVEGEERKFDYVECHHGGLTFNPCFVRKDVLDNLDMADGTLQHGVAMPKIKQQYEKLGYKTVKIINPPIKKIDGNELQNELKIKRESARGVCIHIGRGRRIRGIET